MKAPGKHADGDGLYLQVKLGPKGITRSWLFRYGRDFKEHWIGLGPWPVVSLADARRKAREKRALLADGIDPLQDKRDRRSAERARKASAVTFEEAAKRYIAAHEPAWKNPAHRKQWPATLQSYAYPIFGKLPVDEIDTGLVLKALEPIWKTKPETAGRVRGRIESVLAWAAARGYRPRGDNPARWRGHLDKLLPAKTKIRKVRHQPALRYEELPAFIVDLQRRGGVSAKALEFTILTAARTSEAIGARWREIDLAEKVWTVPGARTKSAREHRVPLSARALEILKGLPREGDDGFIFVGGKESAGLSNMAMLGLLKDLRPDCTVHGFRASFRTWAREQTNFPREIAEAALAHVIGDKTEAAYARGDVLEKRRRLMEAWSRHCGAGPGKGEDKVVPLQSGAL